MLNRRNIRPIILRLELNNNNEEGGIEREHSDSEHKKEGFIKRLFSSDTLMVSIFPIFVFLIVYIKYASFLLHFGIPLIYVEFNISDVINQITNTLILLIGINFVVLGIIGSIPSKISNQIPLKLLCTSIYFISLWLLALFIFIDTKEIFFVWTIFLLFFVFPVIIIPLIALIVNVFMKVYKPKEMIEKYYQEMFSDLDERISKGIQILGGVRNTVLMFTYIGLLLAAILEGTTSSRLQKVYFLAIDKPDECVVLYQSSERIICSPFDRVKKEVEPAFKIIYFQNHPDLELRQEEVGPLHLRPTPTPTLKPTLTPTITNTPSPTLTPTSIPATVSPADT